MPLSCFFLKFKLKPRLLKSTTHCIFNIYALSIRKILEHSCFCSIFCHACCLIWTATNHINQLYTRIYHQTNWFYLNGYNLIENKYTKAEPNRTFRIAFYVRTNPSVALKVSWAISKYHSWAILTRKVVQIMYANSISLLNQMTYNS